MPPKEEETTWVKETEGIELGSLILIDLGGVRVVADVAPRGVCRRKERRHGDEKQDTEPTQRLAHHDDLQDRRTSRAIGMNPALLVTIKSHTGVQSMNRAGCRQARSRPPA
jgi:hypothetical protein